MRIYLPFLALVLGCSPASLRGEDSPDIPLPSSRKISVVADPERNPFAKVEQPKLEVPTEATDAKSEEGRIEAVLEGLPVVGRTRGPSGWKVLLGDLILETGKILPHVIEGQTQQLRVAAIYDSMIEIEWVNKDPKDSKDAHAVPKRIFLVVKLNPTVSLALSGQHASPNKSAQPAIITQPQHTSAPPSYVYPPAP